LTRLIKDEFDAFLECGIMADGFLRLRCFECAYKWHLATADLDSQNHPSGQFLTQGGREP